MSDLNIHAYDTGRQPPEQRWSTEDLQREFEVLGFSAPYVTVRRRSDGALGSMEFTHSPRWYFDFQPQQDSHPRG